jgi:hypothetical protein
MSEKRKISRNIEKENLHKSLGEIDKGARTKIFN